MPQGVLAVVEQLDAGVHDAEHLRDVHALHVELGEQARVGHDLDEVEPAPERRVHERD